MARHSMVKKTGLNTPDIEWRVDPDKCNGCGDCAAICPVLVFGLTPPPCQDACPINTDVLTYISLICQERFTEALDSISELHPFAGTLGRVCTRPCEKECTRRDIDEPIAIRALKRFAADFGQDYRKPPPKPLELRDEKVAIGGSGPAGLMAAYDLAIMGYQVTILEALPVAGGMLSLGIPEYRLPRAIIREEIGQIESLGVEIRLNTKIGKDITLDTLFRDGYKAILLATGAHRSLRLPIDGADLEGIVDGISFLKSINLGNKVKPGNRVVVLGGGNVAFDCARTALRLGAEEVRIACLENKDEMLAGIEEIRQGEDEGIIIHNSCTPVKITGDNGHISGGEFIKVQSFTFDKQGEVTFDPVSSSEFFIRADVVISAIGQKPDLTFLPENGRPGVSKNGLILADADTLATDRDGIFAAGDNITGPGSVVDALADGKRAAVSIDRYLRGLDLKPEAAGKPVTATKSEKRIWWQETAEEPQQKPPELSPEERSHNFNEAELGLTRPAAVAEARRCLKCAIFSNMDLESCCRETCRICEYNCPRDAIRAH